jgi:hypothetical protein
MMGVAARPQIDTQMVGAVPGEEASLPEQISLTEPCKTKATSDGQWMVFGLAQDLAVHRNWV